MDQGDRLEPGIDVAEGSSSVNQGNGKAVASREHVPREQEEVVAYEGAVSEDEPLLNSSNSRAAVNLTTNLQSMMHLVKGNVGTGILAMASAVNNAGLWTGFVGIFIIGAIAIHCMHLLVNTSHKLCADTGISALDYGEVAQQAFDTCTGSLKRLNGKGRYAKATVNVFLCLTQFGFCIVYVLFVAENVKQVVENYVDIEWPKQVYMCFVLLALIPYAFVRKLKTLAVFSAIANALTAIGLVIVLQYCFWNLKPHFYYPAFSSWAKLPLFFGTTIYAFEGIGVILPIENKMRTPKDFGGWTGVLNTGMVIVATMYVAVGFFGYLTFGSDVLGSITLNLPSSSWLYNGVKLLFSLAIFFTYGLQFYVPAQIIIPGLRQRVCPSYNPRHVEYTIRILFVLLTFVLAAVIPHLDLMISLVGALASSTLAIIFPPILDTIVFWPRMGTCRWRLLKNVVLCVVGIVGFVTGTLISIIEIINAF